MDAAGRTPGQETTSVSTRAAYNRAEAGAWQQLVDTEPYNCTQPTQRLVTADGTACQVDAELPNQRNVFVIIPASLPSAQSVCESTLYCQSTCRYTVLQSGSHLFARLPLLLILHLTCWQQQPGCAADESTLPTVYVTHLGCLQLHWHALLLAHLHIRTITDYVLAIEPWQGVVSTSHCAMQSVLRSPLAFKVSQESE